MDKVKAVYEKKYTKEQAKVLMKSYTQNGYKQIQFFCWGEAAAKEMSQIRRGTIISIIGPEIMQRSDSYAINTEN